MPPLFSNLFGIGMTLTLTFDLQTWILIGVIYSSRTIYLPSLKLLGQSVLELLVAQEEVDWHDLWPVDLNINMGHLLIKDYLPTKFGASGAKRAWVISYTRLWETDIPTDGQTDRPTDMCKAINIWRYIHLFQDIFKKRILYPEFHARIALHLCQRLGRHRVNDWLGNLGKNNLIS